MDTGESWEATLSGQQRVNSIYQTKMYRCHRIVVPDVNFTLGTQQHVSSRRIFAFLEGGVEGEVSQKKL